MKRKVFFALLALLPLGCLVQQAQASMPGDSGSQSWTSMFSGGHSDVFGGITLGYVNKDWRTDFGDYVLHENIWGQENKRIHGVQVGLTLEPCLPSGLGLHSGLFYEYYISVSDVVKDAGYDDFTEHNLYLPLHAMYRIPFTRDSSLSLFGGLGFNWAMWGTYNNEEVFRNFWYGEEYYHNHVGEYQQYGNGEWPRHLNAQWEVGCFFRINMVQLGFTYSRGLTNHHFYDGFKTQQNKIGISLNLVFGDDD